MKKQIGKIIKEFREKRNITQEQLCAKLQTMGCDVTRSALAKIEVGQRHIYPDEIKLIAKALNISYEDILD